jgi:hypothetical protein
MIIAHSGIQTGFLMELVLQTVTAAATPICCKPLLL